MKIKRAQTLILILLAITTCVIAIVGISSFNEITKNITLAEAFAKAKDKAGYECSKSLELDCKT